MTCLKSPRICEACNARVAQTVDSYNPDEAPERQVPGGGCARKEALSARGRFLAHRSSRQRWARTRLGRGEGRGGRRGALAEPGGGPGRRRATAQLPGLGVRWAT